MTGKREVTIMPINAAGESVRHLCRLAFDLNSAALTLAAEAAELARHGMPGVDGDTRLTDMGRTLINLLGDLEGGAKALRRARLAAALALPTPMAATAATPAE